MLQLICLDFSFFKENLKLLYHIVNSKQSLKKLSSIVQISLWADYFSITCPKLCEKGPQLEAENIIPTCLSSGCYNKIASTALFSTTDIYFPQFWSLRSPRLGSQHCVLMRTFFLASCISSYSKKRQKAAYLLYIHLPEKQRERERKGGREGEKERERKERDCFALQTLYLFLFIYFCPHCTSFRTLVPQPGIEPVSLNWEHGVLTTGLPGNPHQSLLIKVLNSIGPTIRTL